MQTFCSRALRSLVSYLFEIYLKYSSWHLSPSVIKQCMGELSPVVWGTLQNSYQFKAVLNQTCNNLLSGIDWGIDSLNANIAIADNVMVIIPTPQGMQGRRFRLPIVRGNGGCRHYWSHHLAAAVKPCESRRWEKLHQLQQRGESPGSSFHISSVLSPRWRVSSLLLFDSRTQTSMTPTSTELNKLGEAFSL